MTDGDNNPSAKLINWTFRAFSFNFAGDIERGATAQLDEINLL